MYTLLQHRACAEHSCVVLHDTLHFISDICVTVSLLFHPLSSSFTLPRSFPPPFLPKSHTSSRSGTIGEADLVQILDGLQAGVLGERLVGCVLGQDLLDAVGAGATEHDDIEERVGSQTVGSVDTHTVGWLAQEKKEKEKRGGQKENSKEINRMVWEDTKQLLQQPSNPEQCDLGCHPVFY
jgi:hypothetical protein